MSPSDELDYHSGLSIPSRDNQERTLSGTIRFSQIPLPPYKFQKRVYPHPTQHPDGHFRDKPTFKCPDLAADNWRDCPGYLFALDLFNHGFFWECHEVLEDLWFAVEPGTPVRHFLQAFIQCTVTHWQASCGRDSAARNLLKRIPRHVKKAAGLRLGLGIDELHEATIRFVDAPGELPELLDPQ